MSIWIGLAMGILKRIPKQKNGITTPEDTGKSVVILGTNVETG